MNIESTILKKNKEVLGAVYEKLTTTDVGKYLFEDNYSKEDLLSGLANDNVIIYGLFNKDDGLIGNIIFSEINNINAQLTIAVYDENLRGNGYFTDVTKKILIDSFEKGGLERITVFIPLFNERMIAFAFKLGFSEEGFIRNIYKKDNKLHSIMILGLLRNEV